MNDALKQFAADVGPAFPWWLWLTITALAMFAAGWCACRGYDAWRLWRNRRRIERRSAGWGGDGDWTHDQRRAAWAYAYTGNWVDRLIHEIRTGEEAGDR